MGIKEKISHFLKDTHGSMATLIVFLLFVVVGLLAIVVDIGHVQAVRNELANAADAAALAGARALYPLPYGETIAENVEADCEGAKARAIATIQSNFADKERIVDVNANDIQVGKWDLTTNKFTPGCTPDANAIRVITRKDESANGPVSMGFARLLFGDKVSVWAEAIAYIGHAAALAPGCALPVAIPHCSNNPPPNCPYVVRFTDDNNDNSAWHTFNIEKANANCIRHIVSNCVLACPGDPPKEALDLTTCPGTPAEIYINNGEINAALQATHTKFRAEMKPDSDSPTGYSWLTQVLLISCGEGPCAEEPGSVTDWKAVKSMYLRGIRCIKVFDVGAAGGQYLPLDPNEDKNAKFIKGCLVDNNDCAIQAPPEGLGPIAVLPKLVWTDSNYIAK